MNRDRGFFAKAPAFDGACLQRIRGEFAIGRGLAPRTSHEGRTVKGSIVKGATVQGRGRRVADAGPLHIQIVAMAELVAAADPRQIPSAA